MSFVSWFNFAERRRTKVAREAAEWAEHRALIKQANDERAQRERETAEWLERKERAAIEAEQAEREREREHQRSLLEGFQRTLELALDASARQNRDNADALMELAKASAAQAEGFTTWLKSFQMVEAPTSSVVREEDEYAAEQARVAAKIGIPIEALEDLPPEFQLAHELQRSLRADVMRDSRV